MADNVNALFPTYLPIGGLETRAKHIKYWFKLKTIINNNRTHHYQRKTQILLAIMEEKLHFALTCKEQTMHNKKTKVIIYEFNNMLCNTNLQAKKQ